MKKAEHGILQPTQLAEFLPFFYQGILTEGLIQPIQAFKTSDYCLRESLDALAKHLIQGVPWVEALEALSIRFPEVLEKLLGSASVRGLLDHVLADICSCYEEYPDDDLALYEALSLLWSEFEVLPQGRLICLGCVLRELQKILQRAQLEQAHQVYLSQDGDRYFHQKYVAAKLIHIQEASHAMTYRTLYGQLLHAAADHEPWDIIDMRGVQQRYTVKVLEPNHFLVHHQNQSLELIFVTSLDIV
jgi:hypothetical protein